LPLLQSRSLGTGASQFLPTAIDIWRAKTQQDKLLAATGLLPVIGPMLGLAQFLAPLVQDLANALMAPIVDPLNDLARLIGGDGAGAAPMSEGRARVTGTVTDGESGAALPGVAVAAAWSRARRACRAKPVPSRIPRVPASPAGASRARSAPRRSPSAPARAR